MNRLDTLKNELLDRQSEQAMLAARMAYLQAEIAGEEALEVLPQWSDTVIQRLAINTHVSWRATVWGTPGWKAAFKELGIRYTRTNLGKSQPGLADLVECGVQAFSIIDTAFNKTTAQAWVDFAKTAPNTVIGLEGPNEVSYNNPADWDIKTRDFAQWLYGQRGNLSVIAPSIWGRVKTSYNLLGPVPADFSNLHYYTGGQRPTVCFESGEESGGNLSNLDAEIAACQVNVPGKPTWITEVGWGIAGPNLPLSAFFVTPLAQAKYLLRTICECYLSGAGMVALYSFMDDLRTPPRYHGLIDQQFNKRPSFYALKSFLALFSDPTSSLLSQLPAPLPVRVVSSDPVKGLPVMQRTDGSLLFTFWQDVDSYNRTTFQDINPDSVPVTIDLGRRAEFSVFRPTTHAAAISIDTAEAVAFEVPDHPVVIEARFI